MTTYKTLLLIAIGALSAPTFGMTKEEHWIGDQPGLGGRPMRAIMRTIQIDLPTDDEGRQAFDVHDSRPGAGQRTTRRFATLDDLQTAYKDTHADDTFYTHGILACHDLSLIVKYIREYVL